jgi:glycosyltransferase involved in cell wall biosynthesis
MIELEKPMGGTEILANRLKSELGSQLDDFNILVTNCYPDNLKKDKINVLWQHNNVDDHNMVKMMQYKPLVENIDQFVFVSNYQYEVFKKYFNLPAERCHVLRNATDTFPVVEKPKDKIRLVYTSTPWRGLGILLKSFELLDRDDIELEVYSGVKIYGKEFADENQHKFEPLFDIARSMKNVKYTDYLPNNQLRDRLSECHIMAYPSAFAETSCLAAIEAMMAGCNFVGSSFGALPETTGVYGNLVPIDNITQNTTNLNKFVYRYAVQLDKVIDKFWSSENQEMLAEQAAHFNKYYSWEYRKKEWCEFISYAKNMKTQNTHSKT